MAICKLALLVLNVVLLLNWQAMGQQHQEPNSFVQDISTNEDAISSFVLARNGSKVLLQKALQAQGSEACFSTSSHLLVAHGMPVPSAGLNPQVEQAQFRAIAQRTRHDLYVCLTGKTRISSLHDPVAARQTYVAAASANSPRYALQGMEFFTAKHNGLLVAVAAIPLFSAVASVENAYNQRFFQEDYCRFLYPNAVQRFKHKDYPGALKVLKEAHDLKWGNAEAYVLLAKTFLHMGQREDALKIAIEVFDSLANQLTPLLAEELGEIFLSLGQEAKAQKAFETASILLKNGQ